MSCRRRSCSTSRWPSCAVCLAGERLGPRPPGAAEGVEVLLLEPVLRRAHGHPRRLLRIGGRYHQQAVAPTARQRHYLLGRRRRLPVQKRRQRGGARDRHRGRRRGALGVRAAGGGQQHYDDRPHDHEPSHGCLPPGPPPVGHDARPLTPRDHRSSRSVAPGAVAGPFPLFSADQAPHPAAQPRPASWRPIGYTGPQDDHPNARWRGAPLGARMEHEPLFPRFSDAEYARRYTRVRAAMRAQGLDALLVYGTRAGSAEVQYLSNFIATWAAMLVFPQDGDPVLLVQLYNHVPNARRVAVVRDVRFGGEDLSATTATVLREQGLANGRLGIVGPLPYRSHEALRQALPEATLADWTRELLALRLIKSEEEFAWLRRGADLSDRAIAALAREARPGLTEHELADIVERAYVGLGGTHGIHFLPVT